MRTSKKHGRRYPWTLWFQRRNFRLIKGKDYVCRSDTMASMIRREAAKGKHDIEDISLEVSETSVGVTIKRKKVR
jgi:hypothetical protein